MEKANNKEALNLNNNYKYITPYTLGLVMASHTNCPIRIGDLLISTISRNPSEDYVGTEWVLFGQGRTLVGVDTSQTEFNTVEKTGGEKTHQLTVEELPKHRPHIDGMNNEYSQSYWDAGVDDASFGLKYQITSAYTTRQGSFSIIGNDKPHNNLQPYITVYFWKRTA